MSAKRHLNFTCFIFFFSYSRSIHLLAWHKQWLWVRLNQCLIIQIFWSVDLFDLSLVILKVSKDPSKEPFLFFPQLKLSLNTLNKFLFINILISKLIDGFKKQFTFQVVTPTAIASVKLLLQAPQTQHLRCLPSCAARSLASALPQLPSCIATQLHQKLPEETGRV